MKGRAEGIIHNETMLELITLESEALEIYYLFSLYLYYLYNILVFSSFLLLYSFEKRTDSGPGLQNRFP